MQQRTLAIIKPDAVSNLYTGQIINLIELNKFKIIAIKKLLMTRTMGEEFYSVHKERPFFNELVEYITSGEVVVLALEKENAVEQWRKLMGATDPLKADVGTIRYAYGTSIGVNATHGSDSVENGIKEVKFFFDNL